MKTLRPLGLYIHIPFCKAKCIYCDFYSLPRSEGRMDAYTDALCCVSFTPVSDDARESLADFGWDVLDLSNEDSWGTVMSTRSDLKSSN